jgi:hypothetical protein
VGGFVFAAKKITSECRGSDSDGAESLVCYESEGNALMRTNCLTKTFLLGCLILPTAMRADVLNGGFETTSTDPIEAGGILYNASPWTIVDPNLLPPSDEGTGVCLVTSCGDPFGPHSGSAYFFGGAWDGTSGLNGNFGKVSQSVSTTPGAVYELSFWLAQPAAGSSNFWAVLWDGADVNFSPSNLVFPYTQFVFSVTGTGSDPLEFQFFDDAQIGRLAGYELDDVSLTCTANCPGATSFSTIPEPGSGELVAMFFGVAGLVVFKKRSSMLTSPRVREDY